MKLSKLSLVTTAVLFTLFAALQSGADAGRGGRGGGGRGKPSFGGSRGGGRPSMNRSGGSRSGGSRAGGRGSRPSAGRGGAQGRGTRGPGSIFKDGRGGKGGSGGIGSRPGQNRGPSHGPGNSGPRGTKFSDGFGGGPRGSSNGPGPKGRGPFSQASGNQGPGNNGPGNNGPREHGDNPRGAGEGRPENTPFSDAAEQAGWEQGQGFENAQSGFENSQSDSGSGDSSESSGNSDSSSSSSSSSDASGDSGSYDYDIDVDADVDVSGVPYYGAYGAYGAYAATAYGVAVALPSYAAYFGVVPSYYPAYYPTSAGSSVTYVYTDGEPVDETTVIVNNTTSSDSTETTGTEATYPESITSSIESLNATPGATESMATGTQLFSDRDYQAAAVQFARAADLDPDNGLPLFSLAQAQFATGDFQNSALNIRRGLDRMPEWVSSGNDLRRLYSNPSDLQVQRTALVNHMKANPDDHQALVVLGYVDFFGGQLKGAEHSFSKLTEERPLDPIGPHFLDQLAKIQKHVATPAK